MLINKEAKIEYERSLLERWEWLTAKIDNYDIKLNTSIVLENTYDTMIQGGQLNEGWLESTILNEDEELNEAPTVSTAVGSNLIPKVMFPMIRRVFPALIANQLVSVQPIAGPTGVIYYIIYTFTNQKGGIDAADEYSALPQESLPGYATYYSSEKIGPFTGTIADSGSDTTVDCGTDISAFLGTTAADFTVKRIDVFPSGTGDAPQVSKYTTAQFAKGSGAPSWSGNVNTYYDVAAGDIYLRDVNDLDAGVVDIPWLAGQTVTVFLVYNQENSTDIPEMEFSIGSQTVETWERKLKIRWTKESEQDMKSYHKIDVESELVKAASMEMNYEIDREVLTFISDSVIADLDFIHDWTADAPSSGNNAQGNFLDRHRALAQKVYQASAKIAQYNRQGPATWAVVSPQVGALINMLPDFKGEISGGTFNVFEAGRLGSGLKVFVDPNRFGAVSNEILLGYKSSSSTYGAGVVYAPYTNWMSNTVTHPDSFNSIRGFFSRYAIKLVQRGQFFYAKVNLLNYGI